MALSSGSCRDQSPRGDRPNMSDLRIVLLGNKPSENNKVGNLILDKYIFGKKTPHPDVEMFSETVKGRIITVISTTHLLKAKLSPENIREKVLEVSNPEPHVIILVLKQSKLSVKKRQRIPLVLNCFGNKMINRTLVLTTNEEIHSAKPKPENEFFQQMIKECGGRHLQFQNTQLSHILQKLDEIITCELKKTQQGLLSDQGDNASSTVVGPEMKTLMIVLCGYDAKLKTPMSDLLLGKKTPTSTQQEFRSECVRTDVGLHGRLISLLELPALSRISNEEVIRQTLCHPGVHAFLLILPSAPLTDEDKAEMEEIHKIFGFRENFILLFTSYSSKERAKDFIKSSTESQSLISLYRDQYRVIGLKEAENSRQIPELLDYIENMQTQPYSPQMYVKAQENRARQELEEKHKKQLKKLEDEKEEFEQTNKREVRIVLLGKNVTVNSQVGNIIFGTKAFNSESPSVEKRLQPQIHRISGEVKDRHVRIINALHLFSKNISNYHISEAVRECVSQSDPGPHVIILIVQYKDFNEEDMTRVKHVLNQFSEEAINQTVVFTTDEESTKSMFSSFHGNKSVQQLIQECGGGHLQYDKRNLDWQSEIFERIDEILQKNQQNYLTCELFHDVQESSVDAEQIRSEDQFKSVKENKEHSHKEDEGKSTESHKERSDKVSANISEKQKLNLVLCGNDTKRTASVARLLQERNSIHSQQTVSRGECVRTDVGLHSPLINVLELSALHRLSEEEVMRQTLRCVSLCHPGVHAFLLILPAGPQSNDDKLETEIICKTFGSREHFILLFTTELTVETLVTDFVKLNKESQSLISLYRDQYRVMGLKEARNSRQIPELLDYIEKMKTQPYSPQMYVKAQENRARQETEEKYKEELQRLEKENKELKEKINSEGAEDEANDPCLRIVLIGRTGSGKSATGNTILGRKEFHSQSSTDSVTNVCEKRVGEVDGRSVAVVDTPGLFDTTLSNDQVVEEIMKCISLSSPGPHVFVIVLSVGRFIQVESDTVDLIKKIFGPKSAQFSIILFTRGDDLEDESIEEYVHRSKSAELKKLIRDCGDRFLVFNNKEKQNNSQVIQLLNMIEEVKTNNQGRYFTNSMFEEAEMSIKKKMEEILKEREREIENQREELQAKYEMEMKNMMKRLEEEKQKADEQRRKMENEIREKEEKLRKESEEKEKAEQMKRKTENQKRSEEEKLRKEEYDGKIDEMKREIENQRSQYEKQQKQREEEDRKREEKYRQDQEKMKSQQEHIIAEMKTKQDEEKRKRDIEEKKRSKQEEEERQNWERKIKEAENDRKGTQEEIKRQQREWEEEKKRQMKEREEEERKRKEKHEEQLREKQEELEKMRRRFEREREEERQNMEKERQKQSKEREEKEREYAEKKYNMEQYYEQLERERKQVWERRKREDEERQEEERKRWKKMIEDLKQEREEEIKKREKEEKERIEREQKEREEMTQKHNEEIKNMKKTHADEARKQAEEMNDFKERKEQHVQELKDLLDDRQKQYDLLEKLYKHLQDQKETEVNELKNEKDEIKKQQDQKEEEIKGLKNEKDKMKKQQDQKEKERKELLEEIERLKNKRCVIL